MGSFAFVIKWKWLRLLMFLIVFLLRIVASRGSDSDKSALLEFKSKIFDRYGALRSWNSSTGDHCSWIGVSCDLYSRVVALNITGQGNSLSCTRITQFPLYGFGIRRSCYKGNIPDSVTISGELSAVVSQLTELRVLSLPFNEFSGEIPAGIWSLEKLEVLDLEANLFTGSLPLNFSGLKNLKVLNLGFNKITGEIPISITNFLSLQVLNLAGNQISGSIPVFIAKLRYLRGIYLSFNQLTGPIPDQIGDNCESLEYLELAGNYLTSDVPRSIGNCIRLKTLVMYSNMLEVIPSEIGKLTQLELLDVSRNNLGGSIPTEIGNCSKLSILVLSNLWDTLPNVSSAGYVEKLAYTNDEYNLFEGVIPSEITRLSSLRMLWAPRVMLQGDFPSSWGSCENLEMLNLGQNFYSGKLLEGFTSCTKLHYLDLSSNRLSGEISSKIPVPCMNLFDFSGNSFSGSIPKFDSQLCASVVSMNGDSSTLYDPSSVYISYFGDQDEIKSSFTFSKNDESLLVLHNFGSNRLTGPLQSLPIASEKFGRSTVYAFLASGNKLSGTFPGSLFENCDQARGLIVNISNNELFGEVPRDIAIICSSLMLLDVSNNRISGAIPLGFSYLVSLLTLNLSGNSLQGSIPTSFGKIKNMRRLSLSENNLNGSIPASLGELHSLEILELSSNRLSGEIPKDLANLKNLSILLLNNNNLSGQFPHDLENVLTLSSFNASVNNLSGQLSLNNSIIQCNNFLGNPSLSCTASLLAVSSSDQSGIQQGNSQYYNSPPTSDNNSLGAVPIAVTTAAAVIVFALFCVLALFLYTRKWKPRQRVSGSTRKVVIPFTDIGVPLSFDNVVRATGNFNASNCIGSGGFGATYKAEISPGIIVAVKRLALGRFQGVQQFDAEIKTLARLRHPNLVTLIGYHVSETEMFLIYNYLPGGNLEKFIQERRCNGAGDWRILHKIALDIALALAFLHDECVPRVLHRDVKPSNILLDEELNAYLSDFGLARLLGTSETHATTGVAGTFGYVAPEYALTCRVSDKADVYSYGVVLLELISDKKALDPSFSSFGHGFNIVGWACMLLRQGKAKEVFASGLWDSGPHDDLVEVLHLAVVCTLETLSTRPTMKQVVRRLKQLQPPSC